MHRSVLARLSATLVLIGTLAVAMPPLVASEAENADARLRTSAPLARRIVTRAVPGPSAERGRPTTERGTHATFDPLAPASSFSFQAIPRTGANWPADPTGALSDTWYLAAVNTHYALYDRTGTAVIEPTSFANLFDLPAGTQVFDPKVVYDPYQDTFVLVFLGLNDSRRRSWILVLAIPDQTADDRSTWCGTRIGGDRTAGDGRQWVDYPGLGFSADRVTITANRFDFAGGRFASAQILSAPKANLYDCTHSIAFDTFVGSQTRDPDGSPAFTIMPAVSVGSAPRSQFLVSLDEGKRANLVVWRLSPSSTGVRLVRAAVPIPGSVSIAPYGTQCNGDLKRADTWWDPGDLRFVTAFYDADRDALFTAHAISKDLEPDTITGGYVESVVRWYEVQPGPKIGTSEIVRRGVIGTPESDAGWPALATDADGNLFVTYSQASAPNDECLSAYAAEVPAGATSASSTLLRSGEARFEAGGGPERWGDFAAAVRDPVDPTRIALFNQYAVADGGRTTIDWRQIVHLVVSG